jgi:Zn-dependent metalloprotease
MRCHLCSIVPPYILENIIRNGDEGQRERALVALQAAAALRGERRIAGPLAAILTVSAGTLRRTIYDARHATTLPGTLIRGETDPPSRDVAVNEAFDGSGATYDLYKTVYGRNSIDDAGMRLDSSVHYGQSFDNAMWDGRQMVYGDGDGKLFNRFTIALDVIGHELTHGVTQATAALDYNDQAGSLNESFSDVFGSLVKQRAFGQTAAKADWLIGAGLLTKKVKGVALRSLKAPGTAYNDPVLGKDPQPASFSKYVHTTADNGGVHINSGIPNRAFYLVATHLGGNAWERAGRIWYVTLTKKLRASATFQVCAEDTFAAAGELFGTASAEQKAVTEAWKEVGITIPTTSRRSGPPPASDSGAAAASGSEEAPEASRGVASASASGKANRMVSRPRTVVPQRSRAKSKPR